MSMMPVAVWGRPDPGVRLWVPFNGNVSTDRSIYNHTPVEVGFPPATISGGQMNLTSTNAETITYGLSTNFSRPAGQGWTLECFITKTGANSNYAVPENAFLRYNMGNIGPYILSLSWDGSSNRIALQTNDSGFEPIGTIVIPNGVKTHVAVVLPDGMGVIPYRIYVGGVLDYTYTQPGGGDGATCVTGSVVIGKFGNTSSVNYSIDDVRFTARGRYSGASFTPPNSPL